MKKQQSRFVVDSELRERILCATKGDRSVPVWVPAVQSTQCGRSCRMETVVRPQLFQLFNRSAAPGDPRLRARLRHLSRRPHRLTAARAADYWWLIG